MFNKKGEELGGASMSPSIMPAVGININKSNAGTPRAIIDFGPVHQGRSGNRGRSSSRRSGQGPSHLRASYCRQRRCDFWRHQCV